MMNITRVSQIPKAPGYLCGFDRALSGFGPFAPTGQPDRLGWYDREEFRRARIHDFRTICHVIYPLFPGVDSTLVDFNCMVSDVVMATSPNLGYRTFGPEGIRQWVPHVMRRGIPFILVRKPEECTRWFTEPGLGWDRWDSQGVKYQFCHPRERPCRGDYAIHPVGWHNYADGTIHRQTYIYRGDNTRYKVRLVA